MPRFEDTTQAAAPPEEVFKVLYDPARFPEWWCGIGSVKVPASGEARPARDSGTRASGTETRYTMYPQGYPDFPMPQVVRSSRDAHGVEVSCLVSDLAFRWRLEPLEGGDSTRIRVEVELPEREAHRLEEQRRVISESLERLAGLAAQD